MRLCIADPPYPPQLSERRDLADGGVRITSRSRARRYYGGGNGAADHHPDAGEWDDPARHRALLVQLLDEFDGWAIATTPDGLAAYGELPVPARIMSWHRTRSQPSGHRIVASWEAVILYPPEGRRAAVRGGPAAFVRDTLTCAPPGVGFVGAKPEAWTRWVLDAMGHAPCDEVVDLFPGSGSVAAVLAQGVLL